VTESHSNPPPHRPRSSPLRPVIFVAVVFAAVAAVVTVSKVFTPADLVPWRHDFPAARAESGQANKPMLAYFTAEWCGPCQYMRRNVWTDNTVAAALASYVPVKIDVDKDPAVAKQYIGGAIPAFVVLAPDGRVLKTHEGAFETSQFIEWLKGS
jgi:thiol:disulfide interchange protein